MAKAPKIASATGSASSSTGDGNRLGAMIEAAMIKATEDAAAEGITDADEIRARKLAARERVKASA